MVLCYDDHLFSRPTSMIKWMIKAHLFCLFGSNCIEKIQTEKIFKEDNKTVKYIKYYIVLEENVPYNKSLLFILNDENHRYTMER
jgi:hypothetical protein